MRNSSIRLDARSASALMFRRSGIVCTALLPLVLAGGAMAQNSPDDSEVPQARLKASPTLEPPPRATQATRAAADRESIFLRADRLEGEAQDWIQAEGKVELRSRRQTVLADWLRYDAATDEFWGKGNVTVRRGIDWITGPEVRFKRDEQTGSFNLPEFHVGENGSRGDATNLVFV